MANLTNKRILSSSNVPSVIVDETSNHFIQVDFAAPVGYQEPEKQTTSETSSHSPADVFSHF